VTVARLEPAEKLIEKAEPPATPRLYMAAGTLVENLPDSPADGREVSVSVKLDGQRDLRAYPNFHQLLFYGDYKKELLQYCRLFNIRAAAL